ncbi:MAG: DUF4292 domain-containing protein [Cyclobacteriaceae bacterium]|nr:DUF4292 domain-containing protein [Cyclobacteriaceae bacterium]MCH8516097.1 DUF4292 domain-containing protein [Cyclobacteriaceae bacterium]
MNKAYYIFWICGALFLGSCAKQTTVTSSAEDEAILSIQEFDFNYLTSKTKVKFEDQSTSLSATASIRMKKDSIIWMSISPGFGIEAARALITTDSIFVLDKINRQAIKRSFVDISEEFGVKVDFNVMQSALIGNLLQPASRRDKIEFGDEYFDISQRAEDILVMNRVSKTHGKLENVSIKKDQQSGNVNISFGDFQLVNDRLVPFQGELIFEDKSSDKKPTKVSLKHQRIDLPAEKLDFPFSIPAKYAP